MSPEQFAGALVDARADQFAFCVTAWEALWNERPFAGTSYAQLSAAIGLGERRPAPAVPKVPARVRAALERGLSVDPGHRFPGMRELLDAIRPVRRRHWRWGLAIAGAVVAAGVAALLLRGGGPPSCGTAGAEIAALRGDLPELLQQHGAGRIAVKAEALVRNYRERFRGDARQACEADRAHQWSPDIAARSRQCFAVVARTAALTLAGLDPAHPLAVLRHLRRLPPDEQCRNLTHLASRPALPSDPVQLAALTEANATLAVGFDGIESHDLAALRRSLTALEASPARTDPAIAAGIATLRGWVAYDAGRLDEARKLFVDAYYAGRAIDDEQTTSMALGLLIGRGADLGLAPSAVQDWVRTAVADADRILPRSPWLAGRIYLVAARVADLSNDAKNALLYAGRARQALDPHDPSQIDTYVVEGAVLMWSGHVDDGIRAYDTAVAQRTEYSGDDDPELAQLLSNYASSLLDAEHLNDAMTAAQRAAQIIAKLPDPDDDRIDPIRVTLAAVLIGANEDTQAFDLLETARAHSVRQLGETAPIVATIDSNLANIYNARGEHDRAIAALHSALAIHERTIGPDALDVAVVHYNLAASYRYKKDYAAALAAALRCAEIHAAKGPGSDRHRIALTMAASCANDLRDFPRALALTATALGFPKPTESPQTSAWAQLERARALISLHRGAEARPLLVTARAAYAGLEMAERVRQADDLLKLAH
jgi:tetratricopeptide (TPR) repeat protein